MIYYIATVNALIKRSWPGRKLDCLRGGPFKDARLLQLFVYFQFNPLSMLRSDSCASKCQQFDLFPVVGRCPPSPPSSCTGHSFRIYTCHFSSVIDIYELHYCITECVAARRAVESGEPSILSSELLSL